MATYDLICEPGRYSMGLGSVTLKRTFIDDSYTGSDDVGYSLWYLNTTHRGQSFTAANSEPLHKMRFRMLKNGSPPGNVYAELYTSTGTHGTNAEPTGAELCVSDAVAASTLGVTTDWVEFSFTGSNRYVLTSSTVYIAVIKYEDATDGNYIDLAADNTTPTHGGNPSDSSDGTNWNNASSYDFSFEVKTQATKHGMGTGAGSFAQQGFDATLLHNRVLDAAAGSYSLTGSAVTLLHNRILVADQGNYTLTGFAADLIYSGETAVNMVIDWNAYLIKILAPTVKVDAQTLHDFIEDQMATPIGMYYDPIIQPEGKIEDPTSPGIFSQIILVFNSPWQIQFWQGSGYTEIYGGKLVGGLNDQVMKATGYAGDITVLKSPVDGLTVATGAGAEVDADSIWKHENAYSRTVANSQVNNL
jgi:hypothetical protein